jgi:hypothetical protein
MAKSDKIADNSANEEEVVAETTEQRKEESTKGSKKQNAALDTLKAELEESKDRGRSGAALPTAAMNRSAAVDHGGSLNGRLSFPAIPALG